MKFGILTSGGDCAGLNAVIRSIGLFLLRNVKNAEIVGIPDGYGGLIRGESFPLKKEDFEDILALGGTILRTSRQPFKKMTVSEEGGTKLYGLVAYGRAVAHNLINYHAESWFTWRFFHWDTKWPASNVYWDEDRVYLDTAWNPPCNIISHIAIELGTPLAAMWADEDFGQNVGYVFVGRDGYVLSQSDDEVDALTSFCIASCLLDFRQELFRWDVENNMIVMSPGGDKDDELAQRFANMPLVNTDSLPAVIFDHLKVFAALQE